MACMIGVESTEIRSRPKATNSSNDNGVAGRNMMVAADRSAGSREEKTVGQRGQRRQDAARRWKFPDESGACCDILFLSQVFRDGCVDVGWNGFEL